MRPSSGNTMPVFTAIAIFRRPLGGNKSIERLRL